MADLVFNPWMGYATHDIHRVWRIESRRSGRRYLVRRERFVPADLDAGRRTGVLCEAWSIVSLRRDPTTKKLVERGVWGGTVSAHGFRCVVGPRRGERRLYEPPASAEWDWYRGEAEQLLVEIERGRRLR